MGMKKIKFNIFYSLLSMALAWFLGYLCHAAYQIHYSLFGYVTDVNFVLFWTAVFCFVSAVAVVPTIIWLANKFRIPLLFFILFSIIASSLVLLILPFLLARLTYSDMGGYFYIYAAVISIFFSLIYAAINFKMSKPKSSFSPQGPPSESE